MARVRQATAARTATPPDARWLAGQFLVELLVGASRWGRGERISGHFRVRSGAVQHLLSLIRMRASAEDRARLDDLDPARRVETVAPELAGEIDAALVRQLPACARALLAVGQRVAPDLFPPEVPAALEQVFLRAEEAAGRAR
jgi:hypothetical protein